jgi:hypothetical protein
MYELATCSGGNMGEPDKSRLQNIGIEIAKNGFEISARYAAKKSLSQKKGWIPDSYCEPDKYVCEDKACLLKKINELLKDCKDCSK